MTWNCCLMGEVDQECDAGNLSCGSNCLNETIQEKTKTGVCLVGFKRLFPRVSKFQTVWETCDLSNKANTFKSGEFHFEGL